MNIQHLYKRLYSLALLFVAILAFFVFNPSNPLPGLSPLAATNLQQLLIMMGLAGLPGMLVWSSKEVNRLKKVTDETERLNRYKRIVLVRLGVLTGLALLTLLVYYATHMNGALMYLLILLVMFVFVWPTRSRFEAEIPEEQEVPEALDATEELENLESPEELEAPEDLTEPTSPQSKEPNRD